MIVLAHIKPENLGKWLERERLDRSALTWALLGENYVVHRKLHEILGAERRDQEIGALFHRFTEEMRASMLSFMGNLSKSNHSLKWWTTGVASKSVFHQKIFLKTAYIKTLLELEKNAKEIILYVNDPGFLLFLKEHFPDRFRFSIDQSAFWIKTKKKIRLLAKRAYYLKRILSVKRSLLTVRGDSADKKCLLFSWFTPRSFDGEFRYHDLYLGRFADHFASYSESSISPYTLLDEKVLGKIGKSPDLFMHVPHYYNWKDILAVAFEKVSLHPQCETRYEGIDLKDLLIEELAENSAGPLQVYLLFYKGLVRFLGQAESLKMIVHPFEGQPWEKMIKLAVKESRRPVKVFGFQHSAFSALHLGNYCSPQEYELETMPDYLLSNSVYHKKKLGTDGFPSSRILALGDLRFGYFDGKEEKKGVEKNRVETLLVCFTIKEDETLMALYDCCHVFLKLKKEGHLFKVWLKPHPLMPFDPRKIPFFGEIASHVEYREGDIKPLLDQCDLLVYINGAVGCEALQLGKKVVQKITDLAIDLDPLNKEEKESFLYPCFHHQLYPTLKNFLSNGKGKKKTELPSFFDPVKEECFGQVAHLAGV